MNRFFVLNYEPIVTFKLVLVVFSFKITTPQCIHLLYRYILFIKLSNLFFFIIIIL